jgi:glycosyltransferase involved in cell wall biosynthesis
VTVLVSVVVPTCRRPRQLRRCVRALLAQRLERSAFEIIVVDDGRDDATRTLVEALAHSRSHADPALRYLRAPKGRGPAVARNFGWRSARGALIAFTDEDTVPDPEWLANGLQAMSRHAEWSALIGRISVPRLDHSRRPVDPERIVRAPGPPAFATANAFVRRDALVAVDGFDERFAGAWREDADLYFRLLRDVGPVGQCAGAVVLQPAREERWALCLRRQKDTFFDALLYKKHPRLYRQCIRPVPPWNHYLIVAATLMAPWLIAADLVEIAMAILGFAISLVLRLTGQRLRQADGKPSVLGTTLLTSVLIPFLSVYWRLRGAVRFRVLFL